MADVPPDQFARRFEGLVAAIRARTQAAVVVSNVPDVSLSRAVWPALRAQVAARVDAYNRVIATVARRHELRVFDLCRMTRERLPSHPEYLSADGYHPSDLGYQAWADGLWQVVQAAL
jgi:lysophospholipase L1-like esterase